MKLRELKREIVSKRQKEKKKKRRKKKNRGRPNKAG